MAKTYSKHSWEYHFEAFQEPVIAAIKALRWWEWDTVEVRDYSDQRELDQLLDDQSLDVYVVSPTDQQGWTIVWDELRDQKLAQDISEYTASVGLYGHDNDRVDNWCWITFQSGTKIAEYWYAPTKEDDWYRWPGVKRPPGAMTMDEVFGSFGRTYKHLRARDISPDLRLPGMPDQPYRLVYGLTRD
jgi:hypothetical protein